MNNKLTFENNNVNFCILGIAEINVTCNITFIHMYAVFGLLH